jgi:hypothetical protein
MATVTLSHRADGIVGSVDGSFTSDNAAQAVTLGFRPTHVTVFNETDVIKWEKIGSQADANCIKQVTAGTTTLDTGSAIVLSNSGFTVSATAAGNAKAIKFVARR